MITLYTSSFTRARNQRSQLVAARGAWLATEHELSSVVFCDLAAGSCSQIVSLASVPFHCPLSSRFSSFLLSFCLLCSSFFSSLSFFFSFLFLILPFAECAPSIDGTREEEKIKLEYSRLSFYYCVHSVEFRVDYSKLHLHLRMSLQLVDSFNIWRKIYREENYFCITSMCLI